MKSSFSIEEVQEELSLWRKTKKRIFEPIPDQLKEKIISLFDHYTPTKIMRALNLSYKFIHNLKQQINPRNGINFIPYKIVSSSKNSAHHNNINTSCEIIKPCGTKLIIHNCDVNTVMNLFICSS